jgi:hypothetical protein
LYLFGDVIGGTPEQIEFDEKEGVPFLYKQQIFILSYSYNI